MADPLSELLNSILGPPRAAPGTGVMEPPNMVGGGGGLDTSLPRALRTNNPGAIEFGDFAKRHGATGSDGRFAIFPDLESGYRAQEALLQSYMSEGRRSVSDIIRKWAPVSPGSPENVSGQPAYIESVSATLGVRPNDPLTPDRIPQLAEAMAAFESGRPVPRSGGTTPSTPNAAATRQPTTRGPTTMADNTQARPAPFESIFDFMGPPAALRVQREGQRGATERLGMVQGATEAERVRNQRVIDDAMTVWRDIMSPQTGAGAPTNINEALMRFAQTPQFFALGQAGANYTDVIRKLQTNPNAPITLGPGQRAFRDSPEGLTEIGRVPRAPTVMSPGQRAFRESDSGTLTDIGGVAPLAGEGEEDKQRVRQGAQALEKITVEGSNASRVLADLSALEGALGRAGGGFGTGLRSLAAGYGIAVEGASDLQLAQAIIGRLGPAQRTPGVGPMSDFETRSLMATIPNAWQTPEGQKRVLRQMRAMADHAAERGRIASDFYAGDKTLNQTFRALEAQEKAFLEIIRTLKGGTGPLEIEPGITIRPR